MFNPEEILPEENSVVSIVGHKAFVDEAVYKDRKFHFYQGDFLGEIYWQIKDVQAWEYARPN